MDSDSLWCLLGNGHVLPAWGDLPLSKFRCFLYWRLLLGEVFVFQDHPGWMAARCARTGSEGTPERPTGSLLEWSHVWERGVEAVSGPSEAGREGLHGFSAGRPSGWPGPWEAEATPALGLLSPSQPPFVRTCRCFGRQSPGAPEGRASAHIVLQGGLRGRRSQVAHLDRSARPPPPGPRSACVRVLTSVP